MMLRGRGQGHDANFSLIKLDYIYHYIIYFCHDTKAGGEGIQGLTSNWC